MPDFNSTQALNELRQRALSRWDNEGGALAAAPTESSDMFSAELVQLRLRVIALESLMIAVLAKGSDLQLDVAREMAGYISSRPGSSNHVLTIQAADHITDLVHRAIHFRTVQPE